MRILLLTAALIAAPAFAQDDGISGEASINGSRTTGNTETTDVGGALNLGWTTGDWRQKFDAAVDYGEISDVESKNRFRLGYQIDRDINERLYAYANADYFQDEFGAYKYGTFVGGGLGYHAILPGNIKWDLEAGPGYRRQKTREPINVGPASLIESELAGRAFSDFEYDFNDNVSLYNRTELITSSSDTYIWNDIGVTAQMFENFALRASFRVDTHSDVPVGREKTDTITRLGVVYSIN
jgi:putative salt-induced outer membrane protein